MSTLYVNTITPNSGDTVTVSGSLTTTGKLTIGDSTGDTVAITAEITSSLIPDLDNVFDLGTAAKEWKNLWIDGIAYIDTLSGVGNITTDLNSVQLFQTASIAAVSGALVPTDDNLYDLGSSGKEWKDLYIDGTANIDTAIVGTVSSSLVPDGDNMYDLGASGVEWKNLYIDGVAYIDTLSGVSTGYIDTVKADSITLDGNIVTGSSADSAVYSVNGPRCEIRTQLQSSVAVDTGWNVTLHNTSIAANSIIVANVIGGNGSIITGSIVTANVVSNNTASLNFWNTGASTIIDDAIFTASVAIM